MSEKDIESGRPTKIPLFRQVFDQAGLTPEVERWNYSGSGTEVDPYVVAWIENDPRNPMLYGNVTKWSIVAMVSWATLAVTFVSSAYSGGADEILREFECSQEVFTLGLSLFVLGFAIGPLLWAPLSELFGRQVLFIGTFCALTAFNAGAAGSQNIWTLIILRFFAGAFGSSPLTNAGGVIADIFPAKQRGLAMAFFASAPFMGPTLGPMIGGFVGETVGWRWVEGVMAIFTGVIWILGCIILPETYSPVLLRRRADKLSKMTGKVYRSRGDVEQGPTTFGHVFKTSISRPWILLFREPIVLFLSIYMAIIYGTLYMLFGAFPIVYQQQRGWSAGIGGLAFLGLAVGMIGAVAYAALDSRRYSKLVDKYKGFAPPEARLPMCMVGGVLVPVGMFWFAWTNYPSINFMASIAAGVPLGFGMALVFLGVMNYLVDSYTIFAASVLAANAVLRSIFGAVFPLFTTQMFHNLGIHWASCIPAFLALICVPMPFLLYKYGPQIRAKCKYAGEAEAFMKSLQSKVQEGEEDKAALSIDTTDAEHDDEEKEKEHGEDEQEATDRSYEPEGDQPRFECIKTQRSNRSAGPSIGTRYEGNPYDIDRVNTVNSFKSGRQESIAGLKVTLSATSRRR